MRVYCDVWHYDPNSQRISYRYICIEQHIFPVHISILFHLHSSLAKLKTYFGKVSFTVKPSHEEEKAASKRPAAPSSDANSSATKDSNKKSYKAVVNKTKQNFVAGSKSGKRSDNLAAKGSTKLHKSSGGGTPNGKRKTGSGRLRNKAATGVATAGPSARAVKTGTS